MLDDITVIGYSLRSTDIGPGCDSGRAVSHSLIFAAAQSVVEFLQPLFLLRQAASLCVPASGFVGPTASLPAKQGNRTSYFCIR